MRKMQVPEMELIRFQSEDVIATSGSPFYFFSGMGYDKKASDGSDFSITHQGNNVTGQFCESNYTILYPNGPDAGSDGCIVGQIETYSSSELAAHGLVDGAYTLGGAKGKEFSIVSN